MTKKAAKTDPGAGDNQEKNPPSKTGTQTSGVEGKQETVYTAEQLDQIEAIAQQCHEANRDYCMRLGDESQPEWKFAPDWQRESAINGVMAVMENPELTPADSHASWLAEKEAAGWVYGEEKRVETKTHPCIMPYEDLPEEQRRKDDIFLSTALTGIRMMEASAQQTIEPEPDKDEGQSEKPPGFVGKTCQQSVSSSR